MAGAKRLAPFVRQLSRVGIKVSLFIEPDIEQVDGAVALGAQIVELHTGAYCDASLDTRDAQFDRIAIAAAHAEAVGIECHAGHGLNFDMEAVAAIPTIEELNIGHFLIGEAIFGGLESSIKRMRSLMDKARSAADGQ